MMKHIRFIGDPPQAPDDYRTYPDAAADQLVKTGVFEYYKGPLREGDDPNSGKLSKKDANTPASEPQFQQVGTTIVANLPEGAEVPLAPPIATAEQRATES